MEPLYDPGEPHPEDAALFETIFPPWPLLEGFAAMLEDEADRELIAWTLMQRYAYARRLEGDRLACVTVMTYGKGQLCLATEEEVLDGWLYPTVMAAVHAARAWDGTHDPAEGWYRNLRTGRRRIDGDPEQEYHLW